MEYSGPDLDPRKAEELLDLLQPGRAPEASHASVASGLGLGVARGVARQLGGDLRVEAAAGVGTRLVLELPAAASRPA